MPSQFDKLRIAIFTSGRFHVLDLARELDALGHEVAFYSYVPRRRTEQFGLPARCHRALLPYVWPLVLLHRRLPGRARAWVNAALHLALDTLVAWRLERCDVFIGMSGLSVRAARAARKRYGAKVFLERGSRHLLSQKEILETMPGPRRAEVPAFDVRRELAGYAYADTIVVPSRHAEESFLALGVPAERLFRNPYGVDLSMFPPTPAPEPGEPATVLLVGSWSLRKGCDVLWEACRTARDWRLLHVGPILDASLPDSPLFEHIEPVQQWKLIEIYRRAHVLALPSREEGLSLVLAQALACGLPVVCSDRSGGRDLQEMLAEPQWVTEISRDDPTALRLGIERALEQARQQNGLRDILGPARGELSWKAYGRRYDARIRLSMAGAEGVPPNARA